MKHYKLATVIIPKKSLSEDEAIHWVNKHFKLKKMILKKNEYFFRQNTPAYLKKLGYTDYRTKILPNKIKIVIAYHPDLKGGDISAENLQQFVSQGYTKDRKDFDGFILDTDLSTDENQVYHNDQTGQTVVNLRGTEGTLKDWRNNVIGAVGMYKTTDRYKRAEQVKNDAIAKYGKISVVSHSQGAFSGHEFAKDDNVEEVVHINPAPTGKIKKNEYVVRSAADIVSIPTAIANIGNKRVTHILPSIPILNPYNLAKFILSEHSSKILGKLNPSKMFGRS